MYICDNYCSITSSPSPFGSSTAQATCLADQPKPVKEYKYPEKLPGQLYDANTQCKWQFGEKAKLCMLDFKKASDYWPVLSALLFIKTILFSVTDIDVFCTYWVPTKCQILYVRAGPI